MAAVPACPRSRSRRSAVLLAGALGLALVVPGARAQDTEPDGTVLALVGGEVRPVSGPAIPGGTVLIRDGRIAAVGADVTIPDGARTIDCTGKVVTPGFLDADSGLGISPTERAGGRVSPEVRVADGVDPWSASIRVAREQGVTGWFGTAGVRADLGGTCSVLAAAPSPDHVRVAEAGVTFNLSESGNAGGVWGAARRASVRASLAAIRDLRDELARWRESLAEFEEKRAKTRFLPEERLLLPESVRAAMRSWTPTQLDSWRKTAFKSMGREESYKGPKRAPREPRKPRTRSERDHLLRLFADDGDHAEPRLRAVFRAETGKDVAAVLDVARDLVLPPVVLGGAGLLEHAEELKKAKIAVVVTELADGAHRTSGPLPRRPADLVSRLAARGLEPALGSGSGTAGGRFLRLLAARQVANGLSREDALRSVTLWAARAAGVDDDQGSLAEGRRADVVVWSGDPFSVTSRAETVIVDGEVLHGE